MLANACERLNACEQVLIRPLRKLAWPLVMLTSKHIHKKSKIPTMWMLNKDCIQTIFEHCIRDPFGGKRNTVINLEMEYNPNGRPANK